MEYVAPGGLSWVRATTNSLETANLGTDEGFCESTISDCQSASRLDSTAYEKILQGS
jgi:hypothetical protein